MRAVSKRYASGQALQRVNLEIELYPSLIETCADETRGRCRAACLLQSAAERLGVEAVLSAWLCIQRGWTRARAMA